MFANMDYPEDDAASSPASRDEVAPAARAPAGAPVRWPCSAATARASSRPRCGARRASAGRRGCSHETLPRLARRALPGRALLAVERARRRVPAPGRRRHHVVLRRRRVPAAARRRAPRRGAVRDRVPGVRQRARAGTLPAAVGACTTRRGRRARRATSAPAGTSTTCATTTSRELFGVDPVGAALRRSRALPRARPRRDRRGHGARVRRVAPRALDAAAAR